MKQSKSLRTHEIDGFKTSSVSRKVRIKVCVAVRMGKTIDVRDSKDVNSPTLSFTHKEWDAFIQGVKKGEFDLHHVKADAEKVLEPA